MKSGRPSCVFAIASNEIVGVETMGAALLGARWHAPGLEVTVYAGLDVQDHRFLPNDPGNRLRGTHGGVRGGFDVWFEPVRNGMVTVSTSLSTIGSSYWMRAAAGGRVLDMIWIGGGKVLGFAENARHSFKEPHSSASKCENAT